MKIPEKISNHPVRFLCRLPPDLLLTDSGAWELLRILVSSNVLLERAGWGRLRFRRRGCDLRSRAASSTITRFAGPPLLAKSSDPEWFAFCWSSKMEKGGKNIGLVCGVGLDWGLNTISSALLSPISIVLEMPFSTSLLERYSPKITGICFLRKSPRSGKKFPLWGALKNQLKYWLRSLTTNSAKSSKELNGWWRRSFWNSSLARTSLRESNKQERQKNKEPEPEDWVKVFEPRLRVINVWWLVYAQPTQKKIHDARNLQSVPDMRTGRFWTTLKSSLTAQDILGFLAVRGPNVLVVRIFRGLLKWPQNVQWVLRDGWMERSYGVWALL